MTRLGRLLRRLLPSRGAHARDPGPVADDDTFVFPAFPRPPCDPAVPSPHDTRLDLPPRYDRPYVRPPDDGPPPERR